MATVAESPPPVQPAAQAPPVRHGTCRLHLQINQQFYTIRPIRHRVGNRRVVGWAVRQVAGPRVGATYAVTRYQGVSTCTCPDMCRNGAVCKHVRALTAAGLLPGKPGRKGVARASA